MAAIQMLSSLRPPPISTRQSRAAHNLFQRLREVSYPINDRKPVFVSAEEAMRDIRSGFNIFAAGTAGSPTPLLSALCDASKKRDLSRITLHHLHLHGPAPWSGPGNDGRIRSNALFTAGNQGADVNEGRVDFNAMFLKDIPHLFYRKVIPLDVALVQVSEPDEKGYCSLGTSIDVVRSAVTMAPQIIALVNPAMPRTHGEGIIHCSHFDALVHAEGHKLYERKFGTVGDTEKKIGRLIADNLVSDGSTLQMGVGEVPDATLAALAQHKDLGIHTEMFSDGLLDLIKTNVITNRLKTTFPGKVVTSFVYGSRNLYDFVDDNPLCHFGSVEWINNPLFIAKQRRMTAINAFIEIDITGQVCSDSIGERFLSGFGGQLDFLTGAAISEDGLGRAILAAPSTNKRTGESKIVPFLKKGAGVVTTRAHVNYVVTEHGIAQLWGRNMRQRAFDLIRIAHPDHRESLEKAAFQRLKVMPSND